MKLSIPIDPKKIEDFCRRWKISEFSLFGSVLREDFGPESDVDVLVAFEPEGRITYDNRVEILDELGEIFGREVDLVEKDSIKNPFRRHEILMTRKVMYAA